MDANSREWSLVIMENIRRSSVHISISFKDTLFCSHLFFFRFHWTLHNAHELIKHGYQCTNVNIWALTICCFYTLFSMTAAIYIATIIHIRTLMHYLCALSKIQRLVEQYVETKPSCVLNTYPLLTIHLKEYMCLSSLAHLYILLW